MVIKCILLNLITVRMKIIYLINHQSVISKFVVFVSK
ncbi:hypothetical protein SAMN05444362_1023 [Dysgonomonas macrotermitis]|uniref:Uncharacterized protein n=1 Tax=Dysgonomonas macrotermitis TaxID=1346286 RepID=A0A1M4VNP6_9BACT|nr:hypothetical protein SAMN05444362_1023 [Dysgonomonas macrotermitis]